MTRVLRSLCVSLLLAPALLACDGDKPSNAKPGADSAAGKAAAPEGPATAEQIREAKGVELDALSEPQRESFFALINQESSACAKPHSLATSLRDDPDCRDSLLVAQFIADRLAAGAAPTDIKLMLDQLTAALTPAELELDGRPVFGNPKAPVTVVVFADFQCPRCKAEAPVLREEVSERRGQARLVFKHFPLNMHERAEAAALAVEAAHQQGKFWEMHDLVFANQTKLDDADLERYAGQIEGLDVGKWKADLAAPETKAAVDRDLSQAKALKLPGTPAVFVNGRQVSPMLWDGELSGWIDDALRR